MYLILGWSTNASQTPRYLRTDHSELRRGRRVETLMFWEKSACLRQLSMKVLKLLVFGIFILKDLLLLQPYHP